MEEFTLHNCPAKNLDLENMEGEIWIDAIGFDGIYSVSNYGRVKRELRFTRHGRRLEPKILKQTKKERNKHNFLKNKKSKRTYDFTVAFCIDNKKITKHVPVLVGECFIGEKKDGQVYSKKNKKWFDCRASNLEISTYSECVDLSYKKGNNTKIKSSHEKVCFKTKYLYKRLNDGQIFTRLELHQEYGNNNIDHLVRTAVKKKTVCRGSKWDRIPY